ncbi:CLUMA_CG010200, isoform A [Clunio marinus]|uniref:CLUMA_CG010200, isoform A n=1 Tax=Clunio marinus TaxID=568069 RepID=A0A1J1I9C0_9DIPT|nr:CLUMA_CG010200, isoform A [Clunio marinus]
METTRNTRQNFLCHSEVGKDPRSFRRQEVRFCDERISRNQGIKNFDIKRSLLFSLHDNALKIISVFDRKQIIETINDAWHGKKHISITFLTLQTLREIFHRLSWMILQENSKPKGNLYFDTESTASLREKQELLMSH